MDRFGKNSFIGRPDDPVWVKGPQISNEREEIVLAHGFKIRHNIPAEIVGSSQGCVGGEITHFIRRTDQATSVNLEFAPSLELGATGHGNER